MEGESLGGVVVMPCQMVSRSLRHHYVGYLYHHSGRIVIRRSACVEDGDLSSVVAGEGGGGGGGGCDGDDEPK